MATRGLIIGGVQPVHYGHIALVKAGLEEFDLLDFRVGNKPTYKLPYEVRALALEAALKDEGLLEKVSVLPREMNIFSIDAERYQGQVLGSDVFNNFNPSSRHKKMDRDFFRKFPKLVVLERGGDSLDMQVYGAARQHWEITLLPERSSISATQVRSEYRRGNDISHLLPASALQVLKPYLNLFHELA